VGWVIEIVGWLMVALGFVLALVVLVAGAGAAAQSKETSQQVAGIVLAGPLALVVSLAPLWAGLVTVAAGQALRVQVVIARAAQETVLQITHLRRTLSGGKEPRGLE
jgi:uncharacterized membrane protein